ncbi:MAG: hypothetical protein RIG62_19590 [Cyclobacteriaceae bacterium]|jgi:tetratricopeptide (TPR) repeat protein
MPKPTNAGWRRWSGIFKLFMRIIIILLLTSATCFAQNEVLKKVSEDFKKEDYRQAIVRITDYLNAYKNHDSTYLELLHWKLRSYGMLNNQDSVFFTCVEINDKFPSDQIALIQLGFMYGEAENYERAFYYFQKLRQYYPNDPVGTQNISFYLNNTGEYETAIKYADTTLALANDSITLGAAWNNKCYSNIKLGNFSKGKKNLKASFEFFPNNSYAYRNLALILIEERKIEEACNALEKAKQLGGFYITEELIKEHCK